MIRRYFAYSSYLIALIHTRDQWHARATAWARVVGGGRFWTTDYVLLEVADGLSPPAIRGEALELIGDLTTHPSVIVVGQSRSFFERGQELYRQRSDKGWSLTDCLSFVVMTDFRLSDALTSDRHFEQAGFRALLRMPPPSNGRGSGP